ncbi:hypothetical protein WR25_18513 isoform C [Diploscapter pachys]|uniref:JmjC domain-containing protein n=1 Tax=Diploscapter pachys TaxID=2018661 RepID=A0A2A2JEH2_9BILA|nr:hypothetical protein WR25_18513 isoform A [Diploscapter pachys]PAV60169.1 hypothetical protein WR25_18513 isoform B [Diploscapter pachys]PAV60170.1 hypothetical protein WR25_18513 isoform C [Diploscapter pachys]
MMVPWVYVGMCFSTFCWHTEDHWTYSINYHHWGEPKVWYGIGGQQAEEFEKVMVELMPSISSASQDLFHHMTTMINPTILKRKGVNVTTVHQNAGEFVITFPRAYHAGFNEGFNFAEAVNFAPVDWLQMGRLCLNAYGSVKRHCVFSHEELVMKMACKAEQLDIGVCIATLDELAVICTEEALKRTRVKNMGIVRQHKEDLHKMEDDDRTCRICKTTMFFSAVKCKHGRISCLDHVELLCTKCRFSDMSIKYQYELPELATFIKKLEVRTIAYKKWKEEGERLLNGEKKPTLEKMEELLKATKDNRFPATRFVDEIGKIVKNCNSIKEKANLLTNGRMKTRTHTRIQRADNRFKLDELKHFIADVKKQKCDMSTTVKQLEILREKVEKWILSVAQKLNHINFDSLMVHEHEKINLHQLETLLETGENFDLQLDEIYHLKKAIDFVNWRERVMDILHWPEATDEEMKDEEYLEKKRCTAESVLRLMHEGDRFLSKDCSVLMQLHELQKKAIILDNNIKKSKMPQGKRFSSPTSSPHGGDKEKILKSLKELDWCTSEAIDDFRIDLQHQHELASLTDANKLPLSLKEHRQILEGLKGTLSKVFNTNDKLDRIQISFAQRIRFTNSMRELFKQNASYFSLGEIVAERPDWEDLSEGKAVVLKLERNKDREVTEWECCSKQGDSIEEVIKSQDSLLASKRNRLKKLQEFNRSCSDPSRTCCCMGGRIDQNVVECIVCQAKYHACCIEHDKLLYQQYPVAAYLCVRCLRGKRPEISDVKAVLREYKDFESLEIELVRKCVHSAEEAIKDLDTCRNNSSASIDDLEWSVNQVLLSETLSRADLQRVNFHTILEKTHGTILHKQDRLCKEVMNRIKPANSHLPAVLFDRSKTYKKRAGKWSSEESPKKRRRRGQALDLPALERQDQAKLEEEDLKDEGVESDGNNWDQESEEEDGCSSHPCRVRGAKKGDLTSDELVWIQCDGGCNSWFHVLCVGIHDHDVEKIEHWHCDKCAANSQIRSQMVTPPQTSSGSIKIAS